MATGVDAKGTTSFTYDSTDSVGSAERRGVVTTQTVTRAGAAGGISTLSTTSMATVPGRSPEQVR